MCLVGQVNWDKGEWMGDRWQVGQGQIWVGLGVEGQPVESMECMIKIFLLYNQQGKKIKKQGKKETF